jgi:hypothetical protein
MFLASMKVNQMKKTIIHRINHNLSISILTSSVTALLALDSQPLHAQNTRYGTGALPSNSGSYNSAFGQSTLNVNAGGSYNTAIGSSALRLNTSGSNNTATGASALYNNTSGNGNTAHGVSALVANSTGSNNTATGCNALYWNSTGSSNTASGYGALTNNTIGTSNTAVGQGCLYSNTTGQANAAIGVGAMVYNTIGSYNTASGCYSLFLNQSGAKNTASGYYSMYSNVSGSENSALGHLALYSNRTGVQNTAIGAYALNYNVSGSNNIAIGWSAGYSTTGSDNIVIGHLGTSGENGTIRIGTQGRHLNTFVAGIHGNTSPTGVGVFINNQGKLGTLTSSRKFKTDIADMDKASSAVLSLRPVTFKYKPEIDGDSIPQFGLIAEEVAEVCPELVARDQNGDIYTVRYEAVNAMLLNEFLKQDKHLQGQIGSTEEQKRELAAQKQAIAKQQEQIEALTQKLNDLSRMAEQSQQRVD